MAIWSEVRRRVLTGELSMRQACSEYNLNFRTVRKIVRHAEPPPFRAAQPRTRPKLGPFLGVIEQILDDDQLASPKQRHTARRIYERLRDDHGYQGCLSIVRAAVRGTLRAEARPRDEPPPGPEGDTDQFGAAWVLRVFLGKEPLSAVREKVGDRPDLPLLYKAAREGGCKKRKKALAVLGLLRGASPRAIAQALRLSPRAVSRYCKTYRDKGAEKLFERPTYSGAKWRDEKNRAAVIALLHSPPSSHDVNRTTWKMADLRKVLKRQGICLCAATVRKIIRATGFRWRKARRVLTSNDPNYREKVDRLKSILSRLGPNERFFSVDEFGPFAVKRRGGLVLCDPDRVPVVPQHQKSKGSLIVTAALELSTNQVTHFFSDKKDTEEMVKLLDVLLEQYKGCERIYLSWDAASWHDSHKLNERVAVVNGEEFRAGRQLPRVELVPLPTRAQFLNVIESVFSGMARAIIHNSDYQGTDEAKAAISRYFRERNDYFQKHPKRAGKKIWGKERVPAQFSEANNCKDPLWR